MPSTARGCPRARKPAGPVAGFLGRGRGGREGPRVQRSGLRGGSSRQRRRRRRSGSSRGGKMSRTSWGLSVGGWGRRKLCSGRCCYARGYVVNQEPFAFHDLDRRPSLAKRLGYGGRKN